MLQRFVDRRFEASHCLTAGLAVIASCIACSISAIAAEVEVVPAKVEFRDSFARRQLLVNSKGHDATRMAKYVSHDPKTVSVDSSGYLIPHGNGQCSIDVVVGSETVAVP